MEAALAEVKKDIKVKVTGFSNGKALNKRLKDLGILINEIIVVVKNDKKGPVIVKVKGADIVLGRVVSEKILTEVVDG